MQHLIKRARRYSVALAGFAALTIAGKACSDLTAPAGVNEVAVNFRLPAGSTRLDLIVGDSIRPDVVVMLGAQETSRARYVFTSSDQNVVRVYANGDSIAAVDRGTATLVVTLVGTTIGNNHASPNSRTADTILVASAALTNSVTPSTVTFDALTARRQLDAVSYGRDPNNPIIGSAVVWRSTNPAVASVNASGEVTAVGNGTADVYAIFEGVDSTSSRITVQQQLKRYLLTTAAAANMRSINETMPITARAVDSLNNTLTAGAAPAGLPTFISDNPGKVEVDPSSGVMTARGNTPDNPVKITATVAGAIRSDTLQATVTQVAVSLSIQAADTIRLLSVGDKAQDINVLAPDALGTQVPAASINWVSRDPASVVVSGNALATITAQATDTVIVRASADQQADSVIVIVTNDAAAVTLAPKPFELKSLDESRQMTATVTNTAGAAMSVPVTWASRDSSIVQPQATPGLLLARGVGETRIVVSTANGRMDSVLVRVTNAPDTVNIIPTTLTLASVGDTDGTFAVDFKNARGVALPRTAVNWSSQDITIARVTAGTITAVGAGSTYIVGVSPENTLRRDSLLVTVTNSATTVVVSPAAPPTLNAIGATTTLTATVRNASGATIAGAPVAWSVASGSSVAVDAATGVVTAIGNGTSTVRATSGSATGDATVTVAQAISTARSTVTPAPTSLAANGTSTATITVQLRDANDANITVGGATVTLAQNPAIATLGAVTDNNNGTYTATLTAGTTAGSATISAIVNGTTLSNNGVVAFTAGAASQYLVSVSPALNPVAGAPVTVTARVADANGNVIATAGNVVSWSSTGGGTFSAPTSTTDATGAASVTFTTSTTATPHTVTATTGAITGTSQTITPQAGGATQYIVAAATSTPVAGSAVSISAQLADANNNAVAIAGQTVTWTKSDANGTFSAGTSTTNASGVASITLTTHTVAGTSTTVTATTGALSGTSAAITTIAGAAAQVIVAQAPSASAQSGIAFPTQPTIQLRDAQGNNVTASNVAVTVALTSGSGSLSGTTTALTNASGLATFTDLAITGVVGAKTLTYAVSGVGTATSGVALAAGDAAQIAINGGNGQTATVGAAVPTAPSVLVRDAAGNPVSGVAVTFAVTAGGGATNPASGSTVTTDAAGVAALTSWTLGASAGTNTLEATVAAAALAGEPVQFSATATVGAATQITAQSATSQSATVGTAVSAAPSVMVRDASNNPVANFAITFTLTATGGTGGAISSPATVQTNAAGVATLASWTLGQSAGTNNNTVTATGAGLATITFNASGTPGAAQNIIANSTTSQTATVATSVTAPAVIVRDAYNNPVAGVAVSFTLASSGGAGGAIGAGTPTTDASGVASLASWTLGQTAGTNNNVVTASVSGLTGSPVTFVASATPGNAASLVANSALTQSASVGTPVAAPPSVIVRDQFNNAVGAGINVSFAVTAAATGGTIDPAATVATTSAGVATLNSWTLGTTAGTNNNTVTATIPTLNVVTFNASGVAGAATQLVLTTQPSGTATAGVPFVQQPVLELRDAANNLVSSNNSTVVTAARLGGSGALQGTVTATAVGGVVSFTNLAHSTGSTITIQFTAGGLASATSNNIVVSGPDHYVVTIPASAAAGDTVLASAQLVDASNNPVALAGRTVNWTSNVNGGGFAGGAQFVSATSITDANGVAQVSFIPSTLAGNAHQVRATDNTARTGTSNALTVVAAAPAQLAVVVQPTDAEANEVLAPAIEVEVRDAFGNPVVTDPNGATTETISLAFTTGSNTEGATLTATLPQSINWATGRASFADISVNLVGNYSFTASEAGFAAALTDAASNAFNILATTGTISGSTNMTESALNSATLTVQLTNGTFAATPAAGDFSLTGAPAGTSIANVTRNSATEVLLDLDFDNTDFDVATNVSVNVLASALATGAAVTTGNSVAAVPTAASTTVLTGPATVEANAVTTVITLEAREANGTSMTVATNEAFTLTSSSPGTLQFSLNADGSNPTGTATIASGTATTTFYYRDDAQGNHTLTATDGVDEGAALGAPTHGIQVLTPSAAITATNPGSLTEVNLDGATVTVTLTNATYDAVIASGDFSLATAPAGTTILSVSRTSSTEAVLTLDYDLTDFDAASTVSVNVLAGALATGVPVATGTVAVAPDAANSAVLSGPASVEANAVTTALTLEARETNGTSMIVAANEAFTLSSNSAGTPQFSANPDGSGVTTTHTILSGSASTTLYYRDGTPGSYTLTATDGADDGAALGAPTHTVLVLASTAAITGTSPSPLAESTLNGATITVTLTNGTFAPILAANGSDFSLASFLPGASISGAVRNNATQATLTLSFAGSGGAPQNLSVNVLATALATGTPATTGTVPVTNDVP